jgi:hypothetical protein
MEDRDRELERVGEMESRRLERQRGDMEERRRELEERLAVAGAGGFNHNATSSPPARPSRTRIHHEGAAAC